MATPSGNLYLIVAALGAGLILIGIGCQITQLVVSLRNRHATRDLTGDPWDGRTLEWSTFSPAPEYNFAVIPGVEARDAFMDMKEKGIAYQRQNPYQDILMPKNTGVGFIVGGQAFVLGFAMVWHIWWMAIAAGLAMMITLIVRFSSDETERCIPAETVKRIEDERFRQLAEAQRIPTTGDTVSQPARLAYQE